MFHHLLILDAVEANDAPEPCLDSINRVLLNPLGERTLGGEFGWGSDAPLQGIWGRTSSADGFLLRATRFAGSPAH